MNTDLPALPEPSLLPCPFCGHTTPYFERMGTPRQSCIVACGDCGARHESSDEGTRSGSSWNTRAALAAQQPAAVQITDDMARAYLAANTAYWRAVDESVGKPGVWRNGTPHEATLEGLRAALAAAPAVQPSEKERTAILKGVGRINGDGWKDVTRIGEVVYVWNDERPTPYAPGQFPRIGNDCGWTASREQYDFTPATLAEVRECFDALLAQERERVLQGVKGQFEQMLAADRALRLEQPAEAVAPLGYISPKQLPLIVDPDDESGVYIPMRKTAKGNFTLAVFAAAPSAQPVAVFHAHPEDWQYSITLLPGVPMLRNGTLLAAAPSAPQPSGHCTRGDGCVCGGDTVAVRAACRHWETETKGDAA